MRLTFEEFQMLPMQYTFGYSADTHGLRQYQNLQHKICKQVYTPRNKRTGEWGKGEAAFMMTDTKEEFETARELWEHKYLTPWFTEGRPVRDGWYQTDRGMLFFQTHTGQWFRKTDDAFPVLPPQRWRGMRDIPVSTEGESNADSK